MEKYIKFLNQGCNHTSEKYNPKYVFIYDKKKKSELKSKINKTKVLDFEELIDYLKISKSDLSVLAISGYKSLYFLDLIEKV